MSVDGLRAWIGEVERKLGVRTKVMLALAAIAIGAAGTAIYLAVDTRENAVSEKDVQELQQQLEAQIGTGGTTGTADLSQLESELRTLQTEVAELKGKKGTAGSDKGASGATKQVEGAADAALEALEKQNSKVIEGAKEAPAP